jgi:hypothetical protein
VCVMISVWWVVGCMCRCVCSAQLSPHTRLLCVPQLSLAHQRREAGATASATH